MTVKEIVNLSDIGYREIKEMQELIELWQKDKMSWLSRRGLDEASEIKICFNDQSGYVFFSNEEYDAFIAQAGKLEKFCVCNECGYEATESKYHEYITPKCEGCLEIAEEIKESEPQ